MKTRLSIVLCCLAILQLTSGCFAPRPRITREQLQAPAEKGGPWLLAVTVLNDGPGEGAAEITSRMLAANGSVVGEASGDVDLKPHETVTVTLEIRPSAPGPYHSSSEVLSPPE
jgi:hypothetical protein